MKKSFAIAVTMCALLPVAVYGNSETNEQDAQGFVQMEDSNSAESEENTIFAGGFGGTIDHCTASGTVRATGNEPVGLGGIGGCLEMMDSITDCSAAVTIESANGGHAVGGLIGTGLYYYGEETAFAITNCKVTGEINGGCYPRSDRRTGKRQQYSGLLI